MSVAATWPPWTAARVREAIRLIAITDHVEDGIAGLVQRALAAQAGGATMLQLRLKMRSVRDLVPVATALVEALHIPVVVNDRVDLALAAGAAGAHLGMDDLPVASARRFTPPGFLLGVSLGHDDHLSQLGDADYVGVGPVEATPSKSDAGAALGVAGATALARAARRPAVAIGGVNAHNTSSLVAAGFDGVSVIRAVLSQPDPAVAARSLCTALRQGLAARA